MSDRRSHYATSTDGLSIGGTVHGLGPPLVFLHGLFGDGDIDWHLLVGHLSNRFTCYLPSWRGRGLSGDHPDLSYGRMVDDVLAYVDSVGGPTGLVGWSAGGNLALLAAAQSDAVEAVALVGPSMPWLMDTDERAELAGRVALTRELTAEGRLPDAARALAGSPLNDEDIAVAERVGYFEAVGRYVPNLLSVQQRAMDYEGPTADDPTTLGAISAPVLVLCGSSAKPHDFAAARHVADHVRSGRVQELPGAGHAAPLTHPEELADTLTEFFSPTQRPGAQIP